MSYTVTLTSPTTSWTVDSGDPAATGMLADPLRVAWSLPDGVWPGQPDPQTAQVNFYGTEAELGDLAVGVAVKLVVGVDADTMFSTFYGRVVQIDAAMTATPGVFMFTVYMVDHLRALTELTSGTVDWPAESIDTRLGRILAEVSYSGTPLASGTGSRLVAARPASPASVWSLLTELLADASFGIDSGPDGGLGATFVVGLNRLALFVDLEDVVYQLTEVFTQSQANGQPLMLTDNAGPIVRLAPRGVGGEFAYHVPGNRVEFAVDWSRLPVVAINTVTLSGTFGGVDGVVTVTTAAPGDPVLIYSRTTQLTDATDASKAAWFYLMNPPGDRWRAESLTWLTYKDAVTVTGAASDPFTWAMVEPLAVIGTDPTPGDGGHAWVAGMAVFAQLNLSAGQATVTYELDPNVPRPRTSALGADTLDWNDLDAAPYTTRTWAQFDPADSWYDYRLAGTA